MHIQNDAGKSTRQAGLNSLTLLLPRARENLYLALYYGREFHCKTADIVPVILNKSVSFQNKI